MAAKAGGSTTDTKNICLILAKTDYIRIGADAHALVQQALKLTQL